MKSFHSTLAGLLLASTALATPAFAQEAPLAGDVPAAASDQAQPTSVGDIVVLGRFIPEQNRRSPEVAAFLTAEDLQRTGDGTAAEALTRVTGLSIVEGRFVYVRGLGERYSSALLNGSPLPSPEPLQRVVPLDLFPSEILAGVTVQKTYSAAYPGEFGGGVIDLTTVSAPSEPFFNFKSSLGVNSETTGREGLVYFGSRTDFTSFDDGTRDVPGALRLAFRTGRRIVAGADFSNDDLRRIGQSLENAPLRLLQKEKAPVNFGFQASGGLSEQLGFGTLGLVFVAGYDNKWLNREGVRQEGYIDEGELTVGTDYRFQSTQNDIGLNLLGGVSLDAGDHELRWTNFYTRNTTKEARTRAGFNYLSGNVVRDDYTEWSVRQLFSTQLAGEHFFGEAWEAKWRLAYAKTTRDAPYETRFGYGQLPDGTFVHNIQSNRISFSELDDDLLSGGLDLSYRLNLSGGREAVFSVGAASSDNTRTSQQRDLRFVAPNGLSADQVKSRVDYLFSDYNIGPYLQIEEVTGSNGAAAYEADLRVHAAYAQLQAELIPTVNFTAGVRYEDGRQSVTPRDLFGGTTGFLPSTIEEAYALPAATVTWNFAEDMQLRAGASKTIGRPQFRELAPQQYTDVESDRTFIGNPYLLDTEITNYDLRYEWYFARQQYLTLGVFYKLLEKPIESSVVDQGASISQTFLNAPEAVVQGAEIELKKYFEFPLAGLDFVANKRWLMSGNYTYSNSEVRVGEGDMVITQNSLGVAQPASFYVVDGSRLQGQSDHVANLQLGWEDDTARSQATLILNYVSERTSARGRPGEPDLVQDPGVFLDFVYRKDFEVMGRELGLGIELRNLLRTDYDEYQELGQKVRVNNYDLGASASVSLTARF
ncbi:TonB-dependent Receptor Plug Domain protein [compost metagenome]